MSDEILCRDGVIGIWQDKPKQTLQSGLSLRSVRGGMERGAQQKAYIHPRLLHG